LAKITYLNLTCKIYTPVTYNEASTDTKSTDTKKCLENLEV